MLSTIWPSDITLLCVLEVLVMWFCGYQRPSPVAPRSQRYRSSVARGRFVWIVSMYFTGCRCKTISRVNVDSRSASTSAGRDSSPYDFWRQIWNNKNCVYRYHPISRYSFFTRPEWNNNKSYRSRGVFCFLFIFFLEIFGEGVRFYRDANCFFVWTI